MLRDASALSGVNEGIQVGGHLIKTVRFANDQATLASSVDIFAVALAFIEDGRHWL